MTRARWAAAVTIALLAGACGSDDDSDRCTGVCTPTDRCHEGRLCAGVCEDTGVAVADGTPCGGAYGNGTCIDGKCQSFAPSYCPQGSCDTGNQCTAGEWACITRLYWKCQEIGPKPDGTTCASGVCTAGTCGPAQ